MSTIRFSTYVTSDELRELEVLSLELGLPTRGTKTEKNRRILVLMKMVAQATIEEIRTEKRAAGLPALATWEELVERAGIPVNIAKRVIDPEEAEEPPKRAAAADTAGEGAALTESEGAN